MPFISNATAKLLFPLHRDWAIYLPALLISGAVSVAGAFIAATLLCKKKKAPAPPAPPAPAAEAEEEEEGGDEERAPRAKGKGKASKRR